MRLHSGVTMPKKTIKPSKRPLHLARETVRSMQPTALSARDAGQACYSGAGGCDTNNANTCTCIQTTAAPKE